MTFLRTDFTDDNERKQENKRKRNKHPIFYWILTLGIYFLFVFFLAHKCATPSNFSMNVLLMSFDVCFFSLSLGRSLSATSFSCQMDFKIKPYYIISAKSWNILRNSVPVRFDRLAQLGGIPFGLRPDGILSSLRAFIQNNRLTCDLSSFHFRAFSFHCVVFSAHTHHAKSFFFFSCTRVNISYKNLMRTTIFNIG